MKESFEKFFIKNINFNQEMYKKKPSVCYSPTQNSDLFVSQVNDNGDVEWLPKAQARSFNWSEIENALGFSISGELKEYYSSYFFLELSGRYNNVILYFEPIDSERTMKRLIFQHNKNGQYYFPGKQMFLLGNATIDQDDGYLIFHDNVATVFLFQPETNKQKKYSGTLSSLILSMEPII